LCAAVLFPLTEVEEVQVETCAVGSRVSSLDCEVEGIALGVTTALKYFGQYVSRNSVEEIYVFCDCASAVDSVDKMQFRTRDVQRGHYRGKSAVIRGKTAVTGTIFVKLPR